MEQYIDIEKIKSDDYTSSLSEKIDKKDDDVSLTHLYAQSASKDEISLIDKEKVYEKFIDNIVMETHQKINLNRDKYLNLNIYLKKINDLKEILFDDIVFNIVCKIHDIIVNSDFESGFIQVFYQFKIEKMICNHLIQSNFKYQANDIYTFDHVFNINQSNYENKIYYLLETNQKPVQIFDFIFENDIAVFIQNNEEEQNTNLLNNIDENSELLYLHCEYIPDESDSENFQNFDNFLFKLQFKNIFSLFDSFIQFAFQHKNDLFFKFLFLNEFNSILNNNCKKSIHDSLKNEEFKENCMIEGEIINNKLKEIKNIYFEIENSIDFNEEDKQTILNYIKSNLIEILT